MTTADSIYDVKTTDDELGTSFQEAKDTHFIVWDETFFDLIGPQGKVEILQSFPESEHRVHEAPVYLRDTNELLFSDTDIVGWLWVVNVDTGEVCVF